MSSEITAAPSADGVRHRHIEIPSTDKPHAEPEDSSKKKASTKKATALSQSVLAAILLAVLTILLAMFLLGMFQTGEWPESDNMHGTNTEKQHSVLEGVNATGDPFLLALYSTSCMACRRMRRPFIGVSIRLSGLVRCFAAEVGHDINRVIIDLYNVTAVPSVYFVHGGSRVLYVGSPDTTDLEKFVHGELEGGSLPGVTENVSIGAVDAGAA